MGVMFLTMALIFFNIAHAQLKWRETMISGNKNRVRIALVCSAPGIPIRAVQDHRYSVLDLTDSEFIRARIDTTVIDPHILTSRDSIL